MSDPFDVLRTTPPRGAPDVGAIKGRARRIERRRRIAISSAAVVIAAVAVGGVVLRPGGGPSRTTVAQRQLNTVTTTTPQPEQFKAAAPLAPAPTTAETNGSSAGAQATAQRSTPAPPRSAAGPSSGAAGTPTGLQLTVTAQGAGPHMERFTLQACNPSSSSVSVTFPTGQRYDFEVRQNNTLVWRWSDGMAFTMIYGQESWAPKQCKTYTATWNGTNSSRAPAASGSYTVTGVLTSSPRQSTAPKAFCLDVC
jgi:hypothetical protein